MKIAADSPENYIAQLAPDRQEAITKLRQLLLQHLPVGFLETMIYDMIGYVVPHSIYPAGYHVDPRLPLPFINIASQKNFIAFYHMGIYALPELRDWFLAEYPKHSKSKPDMGKSCIRFKKPDQIPYDLLAQLATKISPEKWAEFYQKQIS